MSSSEILFMNRLLSSRPPQISIVKPDSQTLVNKGRDFIFVIAHSHQLAQTNEQSLNHSQRACKDKEWQQCFVKSQ